MSQEIQFGFNLRPDAQDITYYATELEKLGFDFMGTGEHLMLYDPPLASVMSIPVLAAAAGATTKIKLLSSALLLPIYNPVLLAGLIASLDQASNGRYIAGVGVGGESLADFRAADVPVKERGRRANEALVIMKRLWTEQEVSFQGRYYQVDRVALNPGPLQEPHPPIWVAGRQEAAMERAGRFGDGWLPYMYTPARYRDSVTKIRRYAAEHGRDLSRFAWGYHATVVFGETKEEAIQNGAATFHYSSRRSPQDIVREYWLYGTPRDLIKGIEEILDAGANVISLITPKFQREKVIEQARLIAERVIPYFRS